MTHRGPRLLLTFPRHRRHQWPAAVSFVVQDGCCASEDRTCVSSRRTEEREKARGHSVGAPGVCPSYHPPGRLSFESHRWGPIASCTSAGKEGGGVSVSAGKTATLDETGVLLVRRRGGTDIGHLHACRPQPPGCRGCWS